jgi:hypothetical protein
MRYNLLLGVFLLIGLTTFAQAPWRAKLFVHFKDSNNKIVTDTVWLGCDSLGDVGYQPGLDVIDTNLQWNHVYSADNMVKTQYNTDCANLKRNIIGFKKKQSSFGFYAIGNPVSMSWDTMDFRYFDSTYRLSLIEIRPVNGYVNGIDGLYYTIAQDNYYLIGGKYIYNRFRMSKDSIRLLPESLLAECYFSQMIFSFSINIYMGWLNVGYNKESNYINGIIYPNPFSNKIFIEQSIQEPMEAIIFSSEGQIEYRQNIISNKIAIDTEGLKPGIYFIQLSNNNTNHNYKPIKLIKI